MRGDVVFRVYGVHEGRAQDSFFGAFAVRAEAEAEIAKLSAREMHGQGWAARYHNQGFVIREYPVETDFEIPSRPKPRDRYVVKTSEKPNAPGVWSSTAVQVFRRQGGAELERIAEYERNYGMLQTFEPFRQGGRDFALISRDYTRTAVLDLATGAVVAEEVETRGGEGFCPVGFYVPDWWDVNDGSVIPGSQYWDEDREWPTGEFGFVWGCYWGDDSSWKVQYLDLRRIQQGEIARDDRFGYVRLATAGYASPCLSVAPVEAPSSRPPSFIDIERYEGATRVRFAVELDFSLESGRLDEGQRDELVSSGPKSDEG